LKGLAINNYLLISTNIRYAPLDGSTSYEEKFYLNVTRSAPSNFDGLDGSEFWKSNVYRQTGAQHKSKWKYVEWMLEYQQAWQTPAPQSFNCQP
jgi:hypothetical protein